LSEIDNINYTKRERERERERELTRVVRRMIIQASDQEAVKRLELNILNP